MILEDFVMLGTTVPEPNSDGRVFVCSAGVSAEYRKLVRIYPLARRNAPKRWGVYRVPLQRNPKDSRDESFQIAGDRTPAAHEWINNNFEQVRAAHPVPGRHKLLSRYVVGSIQEANEKRLSLAIVQPDTMEVDFDPNGESAESPQMVLFDSGNVAPEFGARRFAWMPRIAFHDEAGTHRLMLRDWGTFEFQRKNSESYFRQNLASALSLKPSSSLLVGNLNNQRTAWIIISVLNGLRDAPSLFDALPSDRKPVPDKVRRRRYELDGWKCVRCGSPDNLTIDHKWPHSRGGTNALDNLQTLCQRCNSAKGDTVEATA